MHVTIIEATGVLGRNLIPRLRQRGDRVRALVRSAATPTPQAAAAIRFEHWSTGIGSANAANTQQTLSYDLTLVNTASTAIDVQSIDLIFNAEIGQRAAAPDRVVKIDRVLPPSATYQVNGDITFDATNVPKAQIAAWGPPIARITVQADYAASKGSVK